MLKKISNLLFFIAFISFMIPAQEMMGQGNGIEWLSWDEGVRLSKKEGKPLLVKTVREGCNWCKQMDKSTFTNKKVIDYVSTHYIAVSLPFEEKEALSYKSKNYNYIKSGNQGYHELALDLSGGRFGTPGLVFLDENLEVVQSFIGYKDPVKFLAILTYFGDGHYLKIPWHKYNLLYSKG